MDLSNLIIFLVLGLVSGLGATIAMTLSQEIEIKITRRKPSLSPAKTITKILGKDLGNFKEKDKWRLNNLVHWSYGLLWGAILSIVYFLFDFKLSETVLIYFLIFWIQGLIIIPASGVAPQVWKWQAKWIGIDAFHHFVYALVASLIINWLDSVVIIMEVFRLK